MSSIEIIKYNQIKFKRFEAYQLMIMIFATKKDSKFDQKRTLLPPNEIKQL
ncbi:hypothetical protein [Leptospira biflexa]|uniref:hypothetical protein n=1 Tax=Leptospira biflexa TaxID=172 RepID=UPI0002D50AE8|nr:hypothetical protein [Leptospira biflexa]